MLEKDSSSLIFKPRDYQEYIGELSTGYTYVKYPFLKKRGYPDGIYRVGPLARLTTCRLGSIEAQEYLKELKKGTGKFQATPWPTT